MNKFTIVALIMAAWSSSPAAVKPNGLFTDGAVLQQGMPVPIWGTAEPGEKVTVKFRDQQQETTANTTGQWQVRLAPLKTGGPDTLTINTVTLKDVLVGEVWLGSGQSNMAGGTHRYAKNDPVLAKLAAESYPRLRLKFSGAKGWLEATPENTAGFSALLFSVGVRLQQELDVPVGLMVGAVGGTPSGHWLSETAFATDAGCKAAMAKAQATYSPAQAQREYEQQLAKWEKAVAAAKQKGEKQLPRKPAAPVKPGECRGKLGHLYEAHIRPFIPYAIRGVLWDQGEAGTAVSGVDQFTVMGALIRGWRQDWGQGDFPFLYVQKPSGGGAAFTGDSPAPPLPAKVPDDGLSRRTHIQIARHPKTFMVTSSDLGQGIHPVDKAAYGARACQVALGAVYSRPVEIAGPLYQSHQVTGNKVRVTFTHVGAGLTFRHADKLQGFALAGKDGMFYWADATIDGHSVLVTSPKVPAPVSVRYAWSGSPRWANLFNKDGLPAQAFQAP